MKHILKTADGLYHMNEYYLNQIKRNKVQTNSRLITLIHKDNEHFIEIECVRKDSDTLYWEILKQGLIEKSDTREPRGFSFSEDMDQLSEKLKEYFTFTKTDIREIFKVSAENTRFIMMNDQTRISDNSFMRAADNWEKWELKNKKKYGSMK